MIDIISKLNDSINSFVWGPVMLAFFLLVGLMFSIRTRFFQVTKFKFWLANTFLALFKNKKLRTSTEKTSISQFQSLCTSLAATLGTGNIAGVATAMVAGGPGAIFWMWLSAFLGMMTSYAENVLSIKYRYKNEEGEWRGGAMTYMEKGLGCKWLAVLFSLFCLLASFGIGNMTQGNSIADALLDSFGIPVIFTGIAITAVVGLVLMGGVRRIAMVTEKLVPFMCIVYIVGAMIIIFLNIDKVPGSFGLIFREAFRLKSAVGGVVGYSVKMALQKGISRGVFTNEAGLGSSVIASAESDVVEPVQQGMWGIFQVFADTIIVCTITAITILSSGVYDKDAYQTYYYKEINGFTISEITSDINKDYLSQLSMIEDKDLADYQIITILHNTIKDIMTRTNLATSDNIITIANAKSTFHEFADAAKKQAKKLESNKLDDTNTVIDQIVSASLDGIEDITIKDGVPLTNSAFETAFGPSGSKFISIAVMLFALSTILGWFYFGLRCAEYLFGSRSIMVYKVLYIAATMFGCMLSLKFVWSLSDTFNGLMAIPNLIAVTLLSGTVITITKDYFAGKKFDPNNKD